jgi:hypothetical protein
MGRSKLAVLALSGVAFALALVPGRARAQSAQDKAAAEAAFEEGKRLMTAHAFAEACPKFAESLRRDPGIGTMLGLADCYEKNGQTASAWAEFREAAAAAARKSDRREALARENAARLEPTLTKIAVRVPAETDVRGLLVRRDGIELGRALWDTAVPVDPGVHAVSATAPGFKEWQVSIDAPAAPGTQTVTVPRLEVAPPEPVATAQPSTAPSPAPPSTPEPPPEFWNGQRVAGVAVAGAGVASILVGSALGLVAKSKLDQSNAAGNCNSQDYCSDAGLSLRHSAEGFATGSTITFVVGGVLVAGGAALWLTAPSTKGARVGLAPNLNGMSVVGRW